MKHRIIAATVRADRRAAWLPHPARRRLAGAGIAALLALAGATVNEAAANVAADRLNFLCERQRDNVAPLPELVTAWVRVVCTPRGQALAPAGIDKAVVWRLARDGPVFMFQAFPFDGPLPDAGPPDGTASVRHLRFTGFAARELEGDDLRTAFMMWQRSFGELPPEGVRRVVQLDASSAYNGLPMHLVLFVAAERPGTPHRVPPPLPGQRPGLRRHIE